MSRLKELLELVDSQSLRNILLGVLAIICGLMLAILTVWANRSGNLRLASIFAFISLLFVILILVFVVPPLARNASMEASQLDLPFELTVVGAFFLGILAVVCFAAWNTGNNLLFVVLSVLISTFVISFFVGSMCLKKIDVKMKFPETFFAGQETPIKVTLSNRKKFFPVFSVVSEVRGFEKEKSLIAEDLEKVLPFKWIKKFFRPAIVRHKLGYFVYVPRMSSVTLEVRHTFHRRGKFIIKDFELSTGFPFGFFRHRRRLLAEEVQITILPRVEAVTLGYLNSVVKSGNLTKYQKGSGVDLLSLRDYQPQDDIRHIDWKATAKSKRLTVRDFAAEDRKQIQIIFDNRIPVSFEEKRAYIRYLRLKEREPLSFETPFFKPKFSNRKYKNFSEVAYRFEKGVSRAASLIFYLDKEQTETRLITSEYASNFSMGKTHIYELLKKLALIEPILINSNQDLYYSDLILKEISQDVMTIYLCFVEEEKLPKEIKLGAFQIITFLRENL